jgi:hypothetical protein
MSRRVKDELAEMGIEFSYEQLGLMGRGHQINLS